MKKQILNKAVFRYFSFGVYCCCPMLQAAFITSHTHTHTHILRRRGNFICIFTCVAEKQNEAHKKAAQKKYRKKSISFICPFLLATSSFAYFLYLSRFFLHIKRFFPPAQRNIIFKKQHSQNQMSTRVFSRPEEVRERSA